RNQCGLTGPHDKISTNPQLGALSNNGGPTATLALAPGSPAIDDDPAGGCTDAMSNLLTTDQRGVMRPIGPACDAGSFEAPLPASNTGGSTGGGGTTGGSTGGGGTVGGGGLPGGSSVPP